MVTTAKITSCGGRSQNEDTVRIEQQGQKLCVVVADGLGGHGGGQIASQTAADVLITQFSQGKTGSPEQIREAFYLADSKVKEKQDRTCAMKTTAVMLLADRIGARWAHVGDSRLYHFYQKKLVKQTMDHSVSQVAVLMGEITQDQIRFHEDRNRVLRALGSDSMEPEIAKEISLTDGFHAFLLCTDGFWEYVYEKEMEQCLTNAKNPAEWLEAMEKLLKSRVSGENDNYTAAAAFCQ